MQAYVSNAHDLLRSRNARGWLLATLLRLDATTLDLLTTAATIAIIKYPCRILFSS